MIENLFYATLAVITYLCTLNHREKMKQLQVANVAVSITVDAIKKAAESEEVATDGKAEG